MATKIRLARHGRKGRPFYHVVVADSRAPRDGRFIEKIGTYNPNLNPAAIELNFDRAIYWMGVGAQPTDTARSILSREGVLMKIHLMGGVKKGAFDEATAERKFNEWLEEKKSKIQGKKDKLALAVEADSKLRFEAESKVRLARQEELDKKRREKEEAEAAAKAAETAEVEETEVSEATATEEPTSEEA